jgi:tRNA threonylcarbamoyl adenosine modification protein (Sua5/YciO/YrdC/YwlC family)
MKIDAQIILDLHQGRVIAYPTEAVFGLGCDPDNEQAVNQILAIKRRPVEKGLILIASDYDQILPYIDQGQLTDSQIAKIHASWPGGTTWVMPSSITTPKWITGNFDSVAVRVSAHPVVRQLCQQFGKPLVSTSANLAGQPAIIDVNTLHNEMADQVDHIVPGEPDITLQPSRIIDALTGVIYRS